MTPQELKFAIRQFINEHLPATSIITLRPVNQNCLQLTVQWAGNRATGFLVTSAGSALTKDKLFELLISISHKIPGLKDKHSKSEGIKELISANPALGQLLAMAETGHGGFSQESDFIEEDEDDYFNPENYFEEASDYLLKVVNEPFTDQEIKSFCKFTASIAKAILEGERIKYDDKLIDVFKEIEFSSDRERSDTIIDVHMVLKVLNPGEFAFWMLDKFGVRMEEKMRYDAERGHFSYF